MIVAPRTCVLLGLAVLGMGGAPAARVQAQGVVVVRAGAGGRQQVMSGATLAVPLVLDLASGAGADIASLTTGLTWSRNLLLLDSIVPGSFGTLTTNNVSNGNSGSVTLSIASATGTTSTVTIGTLWFTGLGLGSDRIALAPTAAGNQSGGDILPILRIADLDVCVVSGNWGDVTQDRAVNIIDAQQIARFSVGLSVVNPRGMQLGGDVTADNTVNIIDAQQVARFSVGLAASARVNTPISFDFPPTAATLTIASVLDAAGGGVRPGSPADLSALPPGSQAQIRLTIKRSGNVDISSCASVAFSSSNGNVATVSANGLITAVAPGTATITVTSGSLNATVSVTVSSAGMAINNWTNTAGGNWSQATNWSLGRVPVTSDSVVIAADGDYTVTLDTTFTANFITLGGGTGMQRLELAARTLTVKNAVTVKAGANFEMSSAVVTGAGRVVNQGTLDMALTDVNTALDNQGVINFIGIGSFNGAFTNQSGARLQIASNTANGRAQLTIANGFTNNGTIDFTSLSGSNATLLIITTGTLTNAPGGTILSSSGSGSTSGMYYRSLDAELDNQGLLQINASFTLQRGQSSSFQFPTPAHRNSGTITVAGGDFFLDQGRGPGSFTNTGTITLASGSTWFVTSGTINLNVGIAGGALDLKATLNLGAGVTFNTANTALPVAGLVAGPGNLINAAGQQMSFCAISAPFDNFGVATVAGYCTLNGASFANKAGATLRLVGAQLTVTGGFTNDGTIDLTGGGSGTANTTNYERLTIANGTLINSPTGTIISRASGVATTNVIDGAGTLDNRGTISVDKSLQIQLFPSVGSSNNAMINSGTITIAADLLVLQSRTFSNTGTVTIGAGRTWSMTGTLDLSAGSLSGPGLLSMAGNPGSILNLAAGFSTSASIALNGTTVNGPGTLTNGAGQMMNLTNVTINTTFDNLGNAVFGGIGNLNGAFTNQGSATLQIVGGIAGTAALTVASGFTNQGLIDLMSVTSASSASLSVTSGPLTNASGATITASAGTGGARTISGTVDNQGSISIAPGTTSTLQLGIVGNLTTSGSIDLKLGGTTAVTQYDRVAVSGNAALSGTLNVSSLNGFVPPANTSYTILTSSGALNGTFATTNIAPSGIAQPPTYTTNSVVLTKP